MWLQKFKIRSYAGFTFVLSGVMRYACALTLIMSCNNMGCNKAGHSNDWATKAPKQANKNQTYKLWCTAICALEVHWVNELECN